MRKAFDIEDINLDELIATAMDDPQAMTSENKAFRGINLESCRPAGCVPAVLQERESALAGRRSRRGRRPLQEAAADLSGGIIGFGQAGLPCGLVWCRRFRAPAPIRTGRAMPGARRPGGIRAGIMASAVASNNRR